MKALELFAGIGGIALAAEWAGIETAAFCEKDEFCQKVLNKHWPDVPVFDDIRTLNKQALEDRGIDVGTIELISGGFPCQPYSIAGKRKGTEDDRDLWPEMFRIIEEIKPRWVVGENVANFANMELDRTLSDLESIGYEGKSFIIPACAVNALHVRKRIFIVAYSNSERRRSVDEGKERRCIGIFKEGFKGKAWKKSRNYTNDLLLTGSREITTGSGRIQRNDDGLSKGMDRLRGLGNAVVPHQIYPIFEYIKMIHEQKLKKE